MQDPEKWYWMKTKLAQLNLQTYLGHKYYQTTRTTRNSTVSSCWTSQLHSGAQCCWWSDLWSNTCKIGKTGCAVDHERIVGQVISKVDFSTNWSRLSENVSAGWEVATVSTFLFPYFPFLQDLILQLWQFVLLLLILLSPFLSLVVQKLLVPPSSSFLLMFPFSPCP